MAFSLAMSGLLQMTVLAHGQMPPDTAPGWPPVLMPAVNSTLAYSTGVDDAVGSRDVGAAEATQTFDYKLLLPLVFSADPAELGSPFGVQIFRQNPLVAIRTQEMGAGWVRIPLIWEAIEPENTTPENYSWPPSLDAQLADLAARNVRVIFTLHGNPSWAATYPGGPIDIAPMSELVEFMEACVAHYAAPPYNVKYWEIYNEPDNSWQIYAESGWGYFGHNPQAYVDILAAVYGPMKAVDPLAVIVFGGIAHDWMDTDEPEGPFVEAFVDQVLALGGSPYFDVMNFHYYYIFHIRWDAYGKGIIGKATHLRDKLAVLQVDKPFVCTESGMWSSEYSEPPGSDELQSRYVAQLFARSGAANLEFNIWYKLVDSADLGATKYGLVNPDYSPKLAYYAYETLSHQLALTRFVRTLDPSETGSDQSEAYAFLSRDGTTNVVVAWTNDELDHDMSVATGELVVVDKFGVETPLSDGDDGTVDGHVTVTIGPNPLYLRFAVGAAR